MTDGTDGPTPAVDAEGPSTGSTGGVAEGPGERAASEERPEARPDGGVLLRGAVVSPGLVIGQVHRKDYDIARVAAERMPLEEVDQELNRFRRALDESRAQLVDLKARLRGQVQEIDARILDTHVAYLKDSVFIADVENLILNEQMRLDAAIAKVVGDFDRIFRLVQNEALRQSAVDLRDVGIRVLRNLEQARTDEAPAAPATPEDYVLVAKELSIVDMFNLSNDHVRGIVTKEGGLTSHAAVFARSMRIPTLTGVAGLLDAVEEGDLVILDATEGLLRVRPDERLLSQYAEAAAEAGDVPVADERPDWAELPARTLDGEEVVLGASCGNLPEVQQAAAYGLPSISLYRTELLYLVDQEPPSREALAQHYSAVVGAARGAPVTFRLLSVDSSLELPYLHERREANPVLGRVGVRALLHKESVLRRQLRALLMAAAEGELRIVLPFVTDCGELRRVREILFEERLELRKASVPHEERVELGIVLETPASLLGVRDLAREADFLLLNLDAVQQYLLATDREEAELAGAFEVLHPFCLRAIAKARAVAAAARRSLTVFGATASREANLPLLLGAGFRSFSIHPGRLRTFLQLVAGIDSRAAERAFRAAADTACPGEASSLATFHHGYAAPE